MAFDVANESLVHADIENMWVGILLWLKDLNVILVLIEQAVDFAVWIFKVTDYTSATDTGFDTCGQQAVFKAMCTEGAFISGQCVVINETSIVRAGLNAVSTGYAAFVVDHYNAVFTLERRLNRTNLDAGCVVTVISQARQHE